MNNLKGTKTEANLVALSIADHSKFLFEAILFDRTSKSYVKLRKAINNKLFELADMYRHMEIQALMEGFGEFAFFFKLLGDIEKNRAKHYHELLKRIDYYKSYLENKK